MNQNVRRCALLFMVAAAPLARASGQGQPTSGSTVRDMIIEDSLTPTKKQLRDQITELRDSLSYVAAVQARITRARATQMSAVLRSQGRELARRCLNGVTMIDRSVEHLDPMYTPDPRGDQALHVYRIGLTTLREDLRLCAHFDSLTLLERPLNEEKLENIATAATEAVQRYERVRDALLKVFSISLPIAGNMYH